MIPDRYAGFILGKNGSRIQKTASKSGCKACVFFFLGGVLGLGVAYLTHLGQQFLNEKSLRFG